MKKNIENKAVKGSPIIVPPDKEREVSEKDEATRKRIANSAPEQFAELKETNLRMKEEEEEDAAMDEEQ
jgi:hypothetical protein